MNYTARQAFCKSNEVLTNFEAVYTHISFLCMENVKRFSEFHSNMCTFSIPTYILGFALYKVTDVKKRLKKYLRSLEYVVQNSHTSDNTIVISWGHIGKSLKTPLFNKK